MIRRRTESGQGLVEAAVATVVVIVVTVLAVVLVNDVGMATYYKQKLGFITDHTAQYFVGNATVTNQQALQEANKLITAMGLPLSNVSAKASVNGQQVTVTLNAKCKLYQNGLNFLPLNFTLSDTGSAIVGIGGSATPWDGWLSLIGVGGGYYVPCKFSSQGTVVAVTKTYP